MVEGTQKPFSSLPESSLEKRLDDSVTTSAPFPETMDDCRPFVVLEESLSESLSGLCIPKSLGKTSKKV